MLSGVPVPVLSRGVSGRELFPDESLLFPGEGGGFSCWKIFARLPKFSLGISGPGLLLLLFALVLFAPSVPSVFADLLCTPCSGSFELCFFFPELRAFFSSLLFEKVAVGARQTRSPLLTKEEVEASVSP